MDRGKFGVRMPLVAAVLAPAVWTNVLLIKRLIALPFEDDYATILGFALSYRQQANWRAKLLLIFASQYQEYKATFAHLVLGLEMTLFGRIDMSFLHLLGNWFLLPIAWMLWRSCFPREWPLERRLALFLPVSVLLFTPAYWQLTDWASSGLLYTPAMTFGMAALYLVTPDAGEMASNPTGSGRGIGRTLAASIAVLLCCFTSPGGFLIYPIGLVLGMARPCESASPPPRYLRLGSAAGPAATWTAAFLLGLLPYLVGYHRFDAGSELAPLRNLGFALGFAGSLMPRVVYALPFSAVMGVAIVLAVRARFDRVNPRMCGFAAWMVSTSLLVGLVRGNNGIDASVQSRYSIHSMLLAICCYSFAAYAVSDRMALNVRRILYAAALAATLVLFLRDTLSASRLLAQRRERMIVVCVDNLRRQSDTDGGNEEDRRTLAEALRTGIYTLPPEVRQELAVPASTWR